MVLILMKLNIKIMIKVERQKDEKRKGIGNFSHHIFI